MLMADALAITLSIVGFLLALNGWWLVCYGFATPWVERAGERAVRMPIRSLLTGVVLSAAAIFGFAVLNAGPGALKVLGAGLLCGYLAYAQIGTAGLVTALGRRLPSPADRDRPWKATIRGGAAMSLAYVLPIVGWFMIMPATWIIGAGAATLSIRRRAHRPDAIDPIAPLLAPTVTLARESAIGSPSAEPEIWR